MKLAWVASARVEGSAVGAYCAALVPQIAQLVDLHVFVEPDAAGQPVFGADTRPSDRLAPREFDHVLYQVGDEARLAFMAPMIRALGGCVVLHHWKLTDFARSAFPALGRGGWRATAIAAREGGLADARSYRRWMQRGAALGASDERPALNRSVVRFGDSFLTHDAELARAIAVDRNAPTPIGVVELGAAPDWKQVAQRYVELLSRFPAPRTARKSLLAMQLAARMRRPDAS